MLSAIGRRSGNALGFLACVGLMGYALYAQYRLGLAPCPLCIFQRVATIVTGILFLIAAIHNPRVTGARVYGALIGLAALAGMLISARHIWIQAQPPGTVAACGADLDYLLEIMPVTEVVSKVLTGSGECGKIDWTLLGLSMPWWVLISLVALGTWALLVNFFGRARPV
jgi:disulfide bond formation protein DsbB